MRSKYLKIEKVREGIKEALKRGRVEIEIKDKKEGRYLKQAFYRVTRDMVVAFRIVLKESKIILEVKR